MSQYQTYLDFLNFIQKYISQSPALHEIIITALKHAVLTGIAILPERVGRALYWIGKINFLRYEPAFTVNPSDEVIWEERAPDGYILFIFAHDLYVDKDGVLEVKCYFDNKLLCWTPRVYNQLFPRPRLVLLPCKYLKVEMINHDTVDAVTIQHVVEYGLIKEEAWNVFISKFKEMVTKMLSELGIPL